MVKGSSFKRKEMLKKVSWDIRKKGKEGRKNTNFKKNMKVCMTRTEYHLNLISWTWRNVWTGGCKWVISRSRKDACLFPNVIFGKSHMRVKIVDILPWAGFSCCYIPYFHTYPRVKLFYCVSLYCTL